LAVQRRICEGIHAQPALDYMPVASLKRLHARLDALQAGSAPVQAQAPEQQSRSATPWRGWMAASVAAVAVAVGLVVVDRWAQVDARLMRRDEALVFKVFESAKDGRARFTAHSSFVDPTTPPGAPPRQSIEARTLAFFARA